ncbi:MAG TPA: thiamine-phosphate kinase [Kineosporiaceae bacterium]|nr:thiamine-phosphate kinase [Kineosporiaceae bacterium]
MAGDGADMGPTIADVGEDGLVGSVLARYGLPPAGVVVGPGDDAAVLDVPGRVVLSTDTLVEGQDFRRDWSSAQDVGRKTAAQNLADLAAMGAVPFALVVSLAAPGDLSAGWAAELADGLAAECARAGAAVVGGDVSAAGEIVITGTALGVLPGPAVLRSGARPGDLVALAGDLGPSAAGLALLIAGFGRGARLPEREQGLVADLLAAHRVPEPPYPAGPAAAAAGASAMIDTSDGLLRDARRVGEASGVVLDLDPDQLAPGERLLSAARLLMGADAVVGSVGGTGQAGGTAPGDPDPVRQLAEGWVLTGGEDHALLACFPAGGVLPEGFRVVGVVRAAGGPDGLRPGVALGGRPYTGPDGWHHFT